jgi:hypothetical protein
MPEPTGKKLVVGKDVTAEAVIKALKKPFKKTPKLPERKLGPGVTIPPVFIQAEQILLEKLISKNAGKKKTGKGAGMENILGMHIGQKVVDGEPTGSLAVVVTVRKKIKDPKQVHASYRIPKRIKVETKDGDVYVPVDVKIGFSVKPHAIGGEFCKLTISAEQGSIACFVFVNLPSGGHTDMLLTNNHVIGRFCNGKPGDDFTEDDVSDPAGNLIAGAPLSCGTLDGSDGLSIDAAIAFAGGRNPPADSKRHVELTFSGDIQRAEIGDVVMMHGARTGSKTRGTVRRMPAFQEVDYTEKPIGRKINIRNVLVIQPLDGAPFFSQPGDSGSLIVLEKNNAPCALLIGAVDGDPELGPISLAGDLLAIQADLNFSGLHSVP